MKMDHADLIQEVGAELSVLLATGRTAMTTSAAVFHPDIQPAGYHLATALYSIGPAKAGRLAALLGMDKSAVSRLAKSLINNGLAQASADPEDGRGILYGLTNNGHDRLLAANAAKASAFFSRLEGWNEVELAKFSNLLRRFNRS